MKGKQTDECGTMTLKAQRKRDRYRGICGFTRLCILGTVQSEDDTAGYEYISQHLLINSH